MKKRRLLFWGRFWRYGIIILTVALSLITPIIIKNIPSVEQYAKASQLFVMGLGLLAMGIDAIVAIIFKMPHILLVNQSAYHMKMNPNDLNWNDLNQGEWIFIGIFLSALGILSIIVSIFE